MTDSSRVRVSIVGVVVAALFCSLVARLWFLQVNESGTIVSTINEQTLRTVRTESPRGLIFDANGHELVANRVSWVIAADPTLRGLPKRDATRAAVMGRLSELLGVSEAELTRRLEDTRRAPIEEAVLAVDVSAAVRTQIAEHAVDYPHVSVEARAVRTYPYGRLASQVLGYVGDVNPDDLKRHPDYGLNDTIGRSGVEAVYEAALRGVPASETVLTNPAGQIVGDPVRQTPGRAGYDVRLTIDAHAQSAAQQGLANGIAVARNEQWDDLKGYGFYKFRAPGGAAVVLDTTNGNVVAMASNPDYDPNESIGGFTNDQWRQLNDPAHHLPLLNRATSPYAPGSTFKLVTSFAAIASGVRSLFVPVDDNGSYKSQFASDQRVWHNAGNAVNGAIDLQRALTVSSDVYFYGVGDLLWGIWHGGNHATGDSIQSWARSFGFGRPTGFALNESAGRVPDAAWRRSFVLSQAKKGIEPYKSNAQGYIGWNPGDDINLAVGQGDTLVTPLQLADAYAAFANGGTLWQPRLAAAVLDHGHAVKSFAPHATGHVSMDAMTREQMILGFHGVVADPKGTAAAAFSTPTQFPFDQVPLLGKTGTAQVGNSKTCVRGRAPSYDVSQCKGDTSWFVGMFGGDDINHPRYVVVVMIEEAGRGGHVAAPVARQIVEAMTGLPQTPIPVLTTSKD